MFFLAAATTVAGADPAPPVDLSKGLNLYEVGYSHLDTQWRWSYPQTIREFIPNTIHDNIKLLEKYPDYIFNFSGANRYRMMKEYYPEDFAKVRDWVARGRWIPCGNSWEESDVNIPSSESLIRQVMFGRKFFQKEFGTESAEYMLPDCFGFPASLPSVLAHCGVRGFSTQKLTWHSAVGIPFNLGVWEGLDGQRVIAALNAGPYTGSIKEDLSQSAAWKKRMEDNGLKSGIFADYQYFGTGDVGGAPNEDSARWLEKSLNSNGPVHVISAKADQVFKDISDAQAGKLPRYKGDLLLIEHSAGALTSQAAVKNWNRRNELLADAAERAAVIAHLAGAASYPREKLYNAWGLVLGAQFHDILPGTSLPKAYQYSWNDEITAMNCFAEVLQDSVAAVARGLDTKVQGVPLVVYNPLSIDRKDVVEAQIELSSAGAPQVVDASGKPVPTQVLSVDGNKTRFIFLAHAPSVGFAVYGVKTAKAGTTPTAGVTERSLENQRYKVRLDDRGDIASIFDKSVGRELLSAPARLAFQHEKPTIYPAWNMDWNDRKNPPEGWVDGAPTFKIVERGPVRWAIEVTRTARDSTFIQTIRLAADKAGDRIEVANHIDWQGRECSLKAEFPLTLSNPKATYNWEIGKIERGNNEPAKFEVPTHGWFDLTDKDGSAGVSILTDAKYGSDKPADNLVRLTLLYSPGVHGQYSEQRSQDWGKHDFIYGISGHKGDWRAGKSDWQSQCLSQPMRAFRTVAHSGKLGHSFSFLKVDSDKVAVGAIKLAEDSNDVIIRLQELDGTSPVKAAITSAAAIKSAVEVTGAEQKLNTLAAQSSGATLEFKPFQIRSIALDLKPVADLKTAVSAPITLPYNTRIFTSNADRKSGAFDSGGRSMPAEMIGDTVASESAVFHIGPKLDGQLNGVSCKGQELRLPEGNFNSIYLLASAADGDAAAEFAIDGKPVRLTIQDWSQWIGQWDNRVFKGPVEEMSYNVANRLDHIDPGYIKRAPVAWFCSHRHLPEGKDEPYAFSYLFKYRLAVPPGAKVLSLPNNPKIQIAAISAVCNDNDATVSTLPLYDDFTGRAAMAVEPDLGFTYLTKSLQPVGKILMERGESYDQLKLAQISRTDYADAGASNGITVEYAEGAGLVAPNVQSGVQGKTLPRLNNGLGATTNDDVNSNSWFDSGEGRFLIDLKAKIHVARVNTFSWHRSNRAPQKFTLWCSDAEARPAVTGAPDKAGWKLLGVVDSTDLGQGGIHATSVVPMTGNDLGTFRHLMWVEEEVGEGTFFTELDVIQAPQ